MSTGKGTKSVRKSQLGNDLVPSVGYLNTVAKHKAALNDTVINLGTLTVPTEATSKGFIQPSGGTLAAMDLQRYKNNVKVSSTLKGLMDNPIDYHVTGPQQITLEVPAADGEIFTIEIEARPTSGISIAAAQPKVVSYTLPATQTDIPTGPYTVNANPLQRIGDFMVIVGNEILSRNPSNGVSGGDYQELPGLVRLNTADAINPRLVSLVWVGALVDNPQDSQLALIQTLGGQIDAMIPTLAALAGVSENVFQTAPNDPDLIAFGAQVIDHESRISVNETKLATIQSGTYIPVLSSGTNLDSSVVNGTFKYTKIGNIVSVSGNLQIDATAASAWTLNVSLPIPSAVQSITGSLSGNGIRGNAEPLRVLQSSTGNNAFIEGIAVGTAGLSTTVQFTYEVI